MDLSKENKPKIIRSKYRNCPKICLQELEAYGKETSVHGLKRMLTNGAGRIERALWTLGFLCALCLLIYFSQYLANSEFKTTIYAANYQIYKVPFPEVTICNKNRLNWDRLELVKQQFLWPANHNTSYEQLFVEIVAMYDTLAFGLFDRFGNLTGLSELSQSLFMFWIISVEFGNIAVLFLGCSIISIVELVYEYFFLRQMDSAEASENMSHRMPALRSFRLRSEKYMHLYKNGFRKIEY